MAKAVDKKRIYSEEDVKERLETLLSNNLHFMSGPTYKDTNLWRAQMKIRTDEIVGIFHLSEVHCPSFRFRATSLYDKSKLDSKCNTMPMVRDNFTFKCRNRSINEQVSEMLEMVEELPKEWTIVQLTPAYKRRQRLDFSNDKMHTNPIFVTVFNCGQNNERPFSVCVDVPKDDFGEDIELMRHFKDLITRHQKQQFTGSYGEFKMGLNNDLKEITKLMQTHWLKEWRVLLMGKYVDEDIEKDLSDKLDSVLEDVGLTGRISKRGKILLRYVVKGRNYLDVRGIKAAVCLLFEDRDDVCCDDVLALIKAIKKAFPPDMYENAKRHPMILVIEESLDCLPWEIMDIVKDHPVSRMPSLHFTYALYKEHENDIVDGWKVMQYRKKGGACVINPGCDLPRMQNRLKSFFEYIAPGWRKIIARKPTSEEMCDLVYNADIFCYNGHGDGFQYIRGDHLKKLRVNSVVLLFGCNSVKLKDNYLQCEPYGTYQNYITACSPCIVGALWNIPDRDTDKLSTEFITTWIPSESPVHWKNIDKSQWETGMEEMDVKKLPTNKTNIEQHEPELLRAFCKAKSAAREYLTRAGCVARGIPVKLVVK